jgi:hypothetical protein
MHTCRRVIACNGHPSPPGLSDRRIRSLLRARNRDVAERIVLSEKSRKQVCFYEQELAESVGFLQKVRDNRAEIANLAANAYEGNHLRSADFSCAFVCSPLSAGLASTMTRNVTRGVDVSRFREC